MSMTPEQEAALAANRLKESYTRQRDAILDDLAQSYRHTINAQARYSALQASIDGGELADLAAEHAMMQSVMAGQDAVIQVAAGEYTAVLESAQEIVYNVTNQRFIKNVPLPARRT